MVLQVNFKGVYKASRAFHGVSKAYQGVLRGFKGVTRNFRVFQQSSREFRERFMGLSEIPECSIGFQLGSRGFQGVSGLFFGVLRRCKGVSGDFRGVRCGFTDDSEYTRAFQEL